MSIKNFKISTGLDLEGLILTTENAQLLINGDALATEAYVTNAVGGVEIDLSAAAGAYIDYDLATESLNVNASDLATELTTNQDIATQTYVTGLGYLTGADLNGYATESFVTSQGYITIADVPAGYSDSDVDAHLSGGDGINYSAGTISAEVENGLVISPLSGKISVDRTTTDTWYDAAGAASDVQDNLDTHTNSSSAHGVTGDVVGTTDQQTLTNKTIADNLTISDGQTTAGTLGATVDGKLAVTAGQTLYLGSDNSNIELVPGQGSSVYIGGTSEGNEVATHSYVDSVAQGLDVKQSVAKATTGPITLSGEGTLEDGQDYWSTERVLVKNQTTASDNGIYIVNKNGSWERSADADGANLNQGAFVFVETGTNAGKGFVLGNSSVWSQFSEAGNYITSVGTNLAVTGGELTVDLSSKQDALTAGTGIDITDGTISSTVVGLIETVDASFSVTDGELSLSDTITIASVELTDSVASVTAASDVFGNADTSTYTMGSDQTVATLPTGTEVADILITIKEAGINAPTRTSKLTVVNTGSDSPTWTEYGIINSGSFPATTVSFDSSRNLVVNVTGSSTYAVKGVFTVLK